MIQCWRCDRTAIQSPIRRAFRRFKKHRSAIRFFSMIFGSIFRYNPGHSGQERLYQGQERSFLGQEGSYLVDPAPVKGIEKTQADAGRRTHV
jgi:hypothetical protein